VRLRRDLEAAAVTVVVMEATGDYWNPFYFLGAADDRARDIEERR
jgi:hypothetical protein